MEFKNLPVDIQAIQWDGTKEHFTNKILKFIPHDLISYEDEYLESEGFILVTPQGDMIVKKDCYVIKSKDSFFSCDATFFKNHYIKV